MRHRLLILAGLAAALGGCGGATPAGPARDGGSAHRQGQRPAPPSDVDAIRRLLTRRAGALQRGAPNAYAATATGRQIRRDRRAARHAGELPLRDVEARVQEIDLADGRAWARVAASYRVRGIAGRFTAHRRVSLVETERGWRVRRDTGARERAPWELARFTPHRSRHFLVLAPPGIDPSEAGLLGALEAGYERMREIPIRARLRRRYLVVVAADADQAKALTQSIRGVEGLTALADAEIRERGATRQVARVTSLRLLVVWPQFAALDQEGRMRVVTHELTHAVLAPGTSGRTPAWLLEGVALYASGDRRTATAAQLLGTANRAAPNGSAAGVTRRALSLEGLSRPNAIARLDGTGQQAGYAYASAAAHHIADRYGERRLLALYDAFNDESIEGRPGPAVVNRAVRRVLGISLARLDRDVRAALG